MTKHKIVEAVRVAEISVMTMVQNDDCDDNDQLMIGFLQVFYCN